jgi:hypothetical protein
MYARMSEKTCLLGSVSNDSRPMSFAVTVPPDSLSQGNTGPSLPPGCLSVEPLRSLTHWTDKVFADFRVVRE